MKIDHFVHRLKPSFNWRQLALLLLLVLPGLVQADEVDGLTKGLMHSFVLEYAKMNPYLTSEKAFSSKEGQATIGKSLKVLAGKVKSTSPQLEGSPGFRITYGLLADHLQKTEQAFQSGEMDHARMRINGLGNLCAACHMQAPRISHFSAFEFVVERSQDVSFNNAEFLFVVRRYDEALAQYDKLVRDYPKSGLTPDQLSEVYRRKLAIFARVYRDPNAATENLSTDLKNKNLPIDVRRNIESWSTTLQSWKNEKVDPAKLKTADLLTYTSKNLPVDLSRKIAPDNPQLLHILRISGLLYERLYKDPASDNTQGLLYYLARCERSLAPLYWYPINEIYLKQCVVQYPKKSYSKRCFEAYREGMQERYFGRPLPDGVQQSINALKEFI
ncbi:MAG: tol-pal system YbgF family protein [Bdellovibrionales bacterium]